MRLTERARDRLEAYLDEVRRSMEGRGDVEADDVVAGVLEHLEAELDARRTREPATAEELDRILERLGSPTRWAEPAGDPGDGARHDPAPDPAEERIAWAALGLGLAGAASVLAPWHPELGWLAGVAGALLARSLVDGRRPGGERAPVAVALARGYWRAAAWALALAVLLAPAVVVWGAAQVGGLLDAWLNPGAPPVPGTRAPGYWRTVAALMGGVAGAWWILAGLLLARWGERLAALARLPSLRHVRGRWLTATGGALLVVSALVGLS